MKLRNSILFLLALALGLVAAGYRFGDSAHGMGMLSLRGGRAAHPVTLRPGHDRYAVIVTAAVLPPFAGNAHVTLEGATNLRWQLHAAQPVLPLGLHHRPSWDGDTWRNLRPRDRLALWLELRRPPDADPAAATGSLRLSFRNEADGSPLLEVPIRFLARTEEPHGR